MAGFDCSIIERANATRERLARLSDAELLQKREEWDNARRVRAAHGLGEYELAAGAVLIGGDGPYRPLEFFDPGDGWPALLNGCTCPDHAIHILPLREELTKRDLVDNVRRPLSCKHHYIRALFMRVALMVPDAAGNLYRVAALRPASPALGRLVGSIK